MAGLSLGIGGNAGLRSGGTGGGTVGGGAVFMSPITPDLMSVSRQPQDYPAAWVMVGLAAWILVVGFHFYHL